MTQVRASFGPYAGGGVLCFPGCPVSTGVKKSYPQTMWINMWTVWKRMPENIRKLWKLWINMWTTVDNPVDIGDKLCKTV